MRLFAKKKHMALKLVHVIICFETQIVIRIYLILEKSANIFSNQIKVY